jgi:ATP-dependent Clp protease ATP-binding subunit ClpC
MHMGDAIKGKVIGQDEAVAKVVKAIQRNRAGLKDPNKPIGSFFSWGQQVLVKRNLQKFLQKPCLILKKHLSELI